MLCSVPQCLTCLITVPAEGIDDQEVPHEPRDANNEDDGTDGVMGMVWYIHSGERMRCLLYHGNLQSKTQALTQHSNGMFLNGGEMSAFTARFHGKPNMHVANAN